MLLALLTCPIVWLGSSLSECMTYLCSILHAHVLQKKFKYITACNGALEKVMVIWLISLPGTVPDQYVLETIPNAPSTTTPKGSDGYIYYIFHYLCACVLGHKRLTTWLKYSCFQENCCNNSSSKFGLHQTNTYVK